MTAAALNSKSRACIAHDGFLTVYEGAVRSAKTVTSLVQFYRIVLSSRDSVFLMSGNTQGSISRNCINGDFGFIALTDGKAVQRTDTDGNKFLLLPVPKGDSRKQIIIYYCGADNIASFKKIRGMSIGAWYADEINLHHREFVEEAERRTFAAKDRRMIWTLNPDVPGHWIYKERIDKYMGMPGYKWQHFTLDDNPAFTKERRAEIRSQYSGVFYDRYILGKRVRAEGLCYPSFSDRNILDKVPDGIKFVVFGVDVGGSDSACTAAATGYYIKGGKLCAVLLDELYYPENKNSNVVIDQYAAFIKRVKAKYKAVDCYFESAEQLIKRSVDDLGLVNVYNSLKKPIIDRIRFADLMYARERLSIMHWCENTIEAVRSAVWDQKSAKENRLDDGTSNIDSLDAFEYSFENYMEDF